MKESKSKYIVLVLLAGISYGVLSTMAKLAYKENYSLGEVSFFQVALGCLILWSIIVIKKSKEKRKLTFNKNEFLKLLVAGIPGGLTTLVYYKAVQEIPASLAIILLFQFVWMGNLIECIMEKKWLNKKQVITIIALLIGTILSAGIFSDGLSSLTFNGVVYGLLSGLSYTIFNLANGKVVVKADPIERSGAMLLGGLILIGVVFPPLFLKDIETVIGLTKYGFLMALMGAVIPPIFFAVGVPKIGLGLTSIVASVELPSAILVATLILHEKSSFLQWVGVIIILLAIIIPVIKIKK